MKRLLLPLMAISIALTSCNRDNDDITNPIENTINTGTLLTKIEHIDSYSGTRTTDIIYNGDKIVKWGDYEITYTGDLITKLTRDEGINHLYFYNPDGTLKMTILDLRSVSASHSHATYYTYKPDGIVEVEIYSVDFEGDIDNVSQLEKLEKSFEGTFTMRNRNVYEAQTISYSPFSNESYYVNTITYEYDDKNTPYKNIKGLSALALDNNITSRYGTGFIDTNGFNNNIIKTHTQSIRFLLNIEDLREDYTLNYEYEYNDKEYPISGNLPLNKKIKFTYQ